MFPYLSDTEHTIKNCADCRAACSPLPAQLQWNIELREVDQNLPASPEET